MKKVLFLITIILLLAGCFFDFHTNGEYAEDAVISWFSYQNGTDNLGKTRRNLENISEIKEVNCNYLEHSSNIYIYKCKITYTPIGETVIPLSTNETKDVYVALTFNNSEKYKYRVYNSNEDDDVYKKDSNLNYGR